MIRELLPLRRPCFVLFLVQPASGYQLLEEHLDAGSWPLAAFSKMVHQALFRFSACRGYLIANELVDWFNQVDATYRADLREFNELNFQRFDVTGAESAIATLKAEIEKGMASLRVDVAEQRTETASQLSKLRTELLRWMVGLWIATIGSLAD